MTPTAPHPDATRRRSALVGALAALALALTAPGARAAGPEPYDDPPFSCEVIDYGRSAPPVPGPDDDPLCVRYDKTNVTVSTLEVLDFLAAEPARFAIAAGRCGYWQQDHWVIRLAPGLPPLAEWQGSYWYDARTGRGGGILRGLRIGGQPADVLTLVEVLRPFIGDDVAAELAGYADAGGGGGASFALPDGFAFESCTAP